MSLLAAGPNRVRRPGADPGLLDHPGLIGVLGVQPADLDLEPAPPDERPARVRRLLQHAPPAPHFEPGRAASPDARFARVDPGIDQGAEAARQVAAALAAAARHGLAGARADPATGQAVDAATLRSRLLDHVRPALRDHGDTETITGLLRRLDNRGTGAGRQRALFTTAGSTPAFIIALARASVSGYEPGR